MITSEHRSSSVATKEYEGRLRLSQEENSQLTRKLTDSEFHLSTLSREIERLNEVLKEKVNESNVLADKNRKSVTEA